MDDSLMQYVGYAAGAAILVIGAVTTWLRSRKPTLPVTLPPFGPLPIDELAKYYDREPPILAWERVRGWRLNEPPRDWETPGTIDHVVLTPRLLEFCSGASGRVVLDFNFLVEKILGVEFDAASVPPGVAPPGFGLVRVHTPSGLTMMIASPQFAALLQRVVASARAAAPHV